MAILRGIGRGDADDDDDSDDDNDHGDNDDDNGDGDDDDDNGENDDGDDDDNGDENGDCDDVDNHHHQQKSKGCDPEKRSCLPSNSNVQGRRRRLCTLCNRGQRYLGTHLRRVHNIRGAKERQRMLYAARAKVPIGKPTPCGRRLRDCPMTRCPAKGLKRIDHHLAGVHNLNKEAKQPKTIGSYLLSVKKLCNFVIANREVANCLGVNSRATIRDTQSSADDFTASLRAQTVRRELELRAKITGALQNTPNLVEWSQVASMRNILITLILLVSGHRSGVITQLSLGEFQDAVMELYGEEESYFIKVHNHKTAGTYGPVTIHLDRQMYQWCRAYMELARNRTPGPRTRDPTAPFFLTRSGGAVDRVRRKLETGIRFQLRNLNPSTSGKRFRQRYFSSF
ncbi:hypothetical protein BSL78_18944 [Apostichopus japonicus]|uniref:Uncharacterized protein n=1 Tax=Stichopus japonicus TaxID=307972 RepID=A0A2G8K896_STIJA|nr:hypothetical protein BSL78_18944 [Apostichopus japonicus]